MASAADVARLREETGAGVMDCKRALEDAKGDFAKAKAIIKERGQTRAAAKAGREAKEGIVEAYVHPGGRIGALVELSSETDFVARNAAFQDLAKAIAMQVAAMAPRWVTEDELSDDERRTLVAEFGDEERAFAAAVLLRQPYIKDPSKTVGELVGAVAGATGENVRVRRFERFQLGEAS